MSNLSQKTRRYIAIGILLAVIIASVVITVLMFQHWEYVTMLESQGLFGLFIIALFAGSPIPVPTPSMILTFTMGTIFNPALVALVSSFGNACGNGLVYLVGRGGLVFFRNLGFSQKINSPENQYLGSEYGNNEAGYNEIGKKPSLFRRIYTRLSMPKMKRFAKKNALVAVFVLGMYPNPFLMAVIMGLGAARYSFWKFFIVCWAGKLVESAVLAYLGYFGLRSILHFFGIETI